MAVILEFQNLRKAGEMDKVLPRGGDRLISTMTARSGNLSIVLVSY